MIAAHLPVHRPRDAKLLVVDADGRLTHAPRSRLLEFLQPSDVVITNDAATLPASLHGVHVPTGAEIEVRLAGRSSLRPTDVARFSAVVFGAGDFRTRTEDRPPPPRLRRGDRLLLGTGGQRPETSDGRREAKDQRLHARVERMLGHPRLVSIRFDASPAEFWAGVARHGRPIQYAHVPAPLALWDVWTPIAAAPAAFEAPSAGFALDWALIRAMRERGIAFATITLAAGISSTGDPELDRRLPFDEPYRIAQATVDAIRTARAQGGRVVAIGTTVVRALEHASSASGVVHAGEGVATQRIGPATVLRVVDAVVSGTHEPDGSHYQVLRAFVDDGTLADVSTALESARYRTHEFGDSILIERIDRPVGSGACAGRGEACVATAA